MPGGVYFFFANVPPGEHVLQSLCIGYHEARLKVEIVAGDTTQGGLVIGRESLHVDEILVEGKRKSPVAPLQTPEVVFSGSKLRQNLSRTIAETIDYEPGIAQRSMRPAPARPVLRGAERRPLAGGRRRRAPRRSGRWVLPVPPKGWYRY